MNRRHLGRTLVVALIGLSLVALPVAGLAAVDDSVSDVSNEGPLTTNETTDDGMNGSDGMETTEEMNDSDGMDTTEEMDGSDDMETTEEMNDEEMGTTDQMDDGDDMGEDESEGGSLDGFGVVAVVLAAVAALGYTRLR